MQGLPILCIVYRSETFPDKLEFKSSLVGLKRHKFKSFHDFNQAINSAGNYKSCGEACSEA